MRQAVSLLTLTLTASADVVAARFVSIAGAQSTAGGLALGVSQSNATPGQQFPAVVFGTAIVESGGAFSKGDPLQSDAQGRAVDATTGPVVAHALEDATAAGEMVEVLLTATPAHIPRPEALAEVLSEAESLLALLEAVEDADKLAAVLASNDVTVYDDGGELPVSGIALIKGGEGIDDLTLGAPVLGGLLRIRIASITSGAVVVTADEGVTIDGEHTIATFDAAGEELVLGYGGENDWIVVENVGSVALSGGE